MGPSGPLVGSCEVLGDGAARIRCRGPVYSQTFIDVVDSEAI